MSLDLYMIGLIVRDMAKSLEFYRQLGLAIPEGSEEKTHVELKMGSGLTFFLDSQPTRWDPAFVPQDTAQRIESRDTYPSILEFYLAQRSAVEATYRKLTDLGYDGF